MCSWTLGEPSQKSPQQGNTGSPRYAVAGTHCREQAISCLRLGRSRWCCLASTSTQHVAAVGAAAHRQHPQQMRKCGLQPALPSRCLLHALPANSQGAYFIGKAVWGKGYRELINLGAEYEQARPEPLVLDVIGDGEDLQEIQAYAQQKGLNWRWHAGRDHADPSMHDYQVTWGCCSCTPCTARLSFEFATFAWVAQRLPLCCQACVAQQHSKHGVPRHLGVGLGLSYLHCVPETLTKFTQCLCSFSTGTTVRKRTLSCSCIMCRCS